MGICGDVLADWRWVISEVGNGDALSVVTDVRVFKIISSYFKRNYGFIFVYVWSYILPVTCCS
jgi:hypothetical protein